MNEMYQALIITKYQLGKISEEKARRLIDKLSQWRALETERAEGSR